MNWANKADYIQIIILAIVFGSAILQLIYRTFFKPVAPPPAGRGAPVRRPAARPAKTLRDFLEEIREEARRAQRGEGAPAEEGTTTARGAGEKAEGEAERGAPSWEPESPPASARPEMRPHEAAPTATEPARPSGEAVHEYLEELARGSGGLGTLESHIGERPGADDPRPLATTTVFPGSESAAAAAADAARRTTRALPLPALGISLPANLARVEFDLDLVGSPRLSAWDGDQAVAQSWSVQRLASAPGYVAALATAHPIGSIVCKSWSQ